LNEALYETAKDLYEMGDIDKETFEKYEALHLSSENLPFKEGRVSGLNKKYKRIKNTERIHKKRMKYHLGFPGKVGLETPKRSSTCRCCGNPRKNEKGINKFTIQERKINEDTNHEKESLETF
jgi:hypothetical protein